METLHHHHRQKHSTESSKQSDSFIVMSLCQEMCVAPCGSPCHLLKATFELIVHPSHELASHKSPWHSVTTGQCLRSVPPSSTEQSTGLRYSSTRLPLCPISCGTGPAVSPPNRPSSSTLLVPLSVASLSCPMMHRVTGLRSESPQPAIIIDYHHRLYYLFPCSSLDGTRVIWRRRWAVVEAQARRLLS